MLYFEDVPCDQQFWLRRARILGGWLVITVDDVRTPLLSAGVTESGHEYRSAPAFVPDPTHAWVIE